MTIRRLALALALAAAPAAAQDDQEERDRGFLVGLIEDNLSAPGLQVRIDGFEGALSSEASLGTLTVADDEGVWLRLEDVVLDWNRSALLRGRLEVEALTADLIRVERAPLPPEGVEALPDAGASGGFSLPNLPVSVAIDLIRAERIELGAPLLGQDLALTLEASARLADGSGAVSLEGRRLDAVEGTFDIEAAYEAGTQVLSVDLDVREAEGGVAATLLQLPGAPAIELTVTGEGPLDDFAADIAVASDGAERLSGAVTLSGVEEGRRFDVDLGGDLTALLAPRYRPFFGDDVGLEARGVLRDAGGTVLERLALETQALTLSGQAVIGADGWPTLLDVEGRLAAQDGGPVLLPVDTAVSVAGARFVLSHDASVSEDFRLDLSVDGLSHPELNAASLQLSATGEVSRAEGAVTGATGRLAVEADGLAFTDPSLQEAVGTEATLSAAIDWEEGQPVRIENLELRGPALEADGTLAYDAAAELPLALDLSAEIAALSQIAGLTGLEELGGSAELSIAGRAAPGGAFDLTVEGAATGLETGIAQADALLEGRTSLAVEARRDETGTYLDALDLSNPQVAVMGSARILAEDAPAREEGAATRANLIVSLTDGAPIDPRLAGPTNVIATVEQRADGALVGTARVDAPQDVELRAEGVLTGPEADVDFTLSVPELEPFAPGVPGGVTAEGRVFVGPDGLWNVDAEATGPYDLTASVEGVVTGDRPEIAYEARLPDPTAAVPALDAVPALAAPVTLSGTLVQEGGTFVTDTRIDAPEGVVLRVSGPVTGPAPRIDFALTVPEVEDFVEAVEGSLSVDGTVRQEGEDWRVAARASGPYEATATVETVLTATPLTVDFTLALPDLSELAAGVPGGLDLSGTAVQAEEGWQVDLDGTGPYDAELAVDARLPEEGPEVEATIRIPDASAIAEALEGPLVVEAQARQRDGVWSAELDASGPFDATATASATLPPDGAEIVADIRVPDAGAIDPRLEGPLTVDLDARQVDGVWQADLDAAGPLGATVTARARLPEEGAVVEADVNIPDSSVLAPRLEGPLVADLDARQQDGVWRVDFDASGPLGASAVGEARLDGQDAEIEFDLRVPDSSVIAPQLNGPFNADVSARQVDGAWTAQVDSRGPFGGTIEATARLDGDDADVDAVVSLPDSSRVSPELSGPIRAVVDAQQRDGVWTADLDLDGPFDATADATLRLDGEDIDVDATVALPDSSRVAEQLSGPIRAEVSARQRDGVWTADLDLDGPFAATGTATARLEGEDADVQAQLSLPDVSRVVPQLSGPLNATVEATQRDGVWTADVDASGPLGASLDVSGTVAGAPVDVDVDLSVPDVSPLVPELSGPLRATGDVVQEGDAYRVDLDVAGPAGTQADVAGTIAPDGTLDLAIDGSAPLGLANPFLEPQRLAGTASFDLSVTGPPAPESVTGTITTQGAALSLPTLRNALEPIDATIRLTGGQAQIDLSAGVESGGTLSVTGPVGLAAPFPADLRVAFDATLEDPNLYTAEVEGALTLTGPLTGGATIAGDVLIDEAEIRVPSTGITAVGDIPPIEFVNTPRPVRRTLERADLDAASQAESAEAQSGAGPGFGLDVTVRAPGRIFVRGRGLDAELGGSLELTGSTNNVITAGGFELIRGRLDILQQRFDLDEGSVTFQGSFVPFVRLVAVTVTDTVTASIVVEGPADDIDVRFESVPELPEEEVLAQIFFGRDLSQLSALQALQLANSVAVLAGRGSGGLLATLRGGAGLDDLDVVTDAEGETAVRAGKYISDNVYTTVQIDQGGDAEISLNLDLTPDLTIRGTTGAAGESNIGIFFERDY